MGADLDLSLPERPKDSATSTLPGNRVLLVLLLLGIAANTALTWHLGRGRSDRGPPTPGALAAEPQRELALRLEKQGLNESSVKAWQDYLLLARPDASKSARVWYRVGKLLQASGDHEQALACYYRSESFAQLDELETEIARRTQECLEALGKFAALRYELAERVALEEKEGTAPGEDVVAEIGGQRITKADLDRSIEAQIERQLSQFAGHLTEKQRNQQKEAILRRFSSAKERLAMLNQIIMSELLYRRAMDTELLDDETTRRMLRDFEKTFLAQRVVTKAMEERIQISAGDVRTYYDANKGGYVEPERARISHILVEDGEKAAAVLTSLAEGKSFEELAKSVSADEATAGKGGAIDEWVKRDASFVPGLTSASVPELLERIFATQAGSVLPEPVKGDKGFHVVKVREREAERQKTFEEVREQASRDLRQAKEREVQEQLVAELKRTYEVVIHQSHFADAKPAEDDDRNGQPGGAKQ